MPECSRCGQVFAPDQMTDEERPNVYPAEVQAAMDEQKSIISQHLNSITLCLQEISQTQNNQEQLWACIEQHWAQIDQCVRQLSKLRRSFSTPFLPFAAGDAPGKVPK